MTEFTDTTVSVLLGDNMQLKINNSNMKNR